MVLESEVFQHYVDVRICAIYKDFVTDIDVALGTLKPSAKLTHIQKRWLGFCLTGILLTNSLCWAKFERASLGSYQIAGLSWMFRDAKMAWDYLLLASVTMLLARHGITEGVLVFDESDRARSKRTTRIHKVYKQKDKASGGYVNGYVFIIAGDRVDHVPRAGRFLYAGPCIESLDEGR